MTVVSRGPDEKYAQVNRLWEGKTAVVIGGGPSLTQKQVDACRDLHAIAVNDAYLRAPWADVLYFADAKWHKWQKNGRDGKGLPPMGLGPREIMAAFRAFAGVRVSISNSMQGIPPSDALFLRNANESAQRGKALSTDPHWISTGHNSCFQALNIAVLAGAARVLFIGLDGKRGPDGKAHWFGDHPDRTDPPYEAMKGPFRLAAAERAAAGIELVNCSPGSVISLTRAAKLEDELARQGVELNQSAALVSG